MAKTPKQPAAGDTFLILSPACAASYYDELDLAGPLEAAGLKLDVWKWEDFCAHFRESGSDAERLFRAKILLALPMRFPPSTDGSWQVGGVMDVLRQYSRHLGCTVLLLPTGNLRVTVGRKVVPGDDVLGDSKMLARGVGHLSSCAELPFAESVEVKLAGELLKGFLQGMRSKLKISIESIGVASMGSEPEGGGRAPAAMEAEGPKPIPLAELAATGACAGYSKLSGKGEVAVLPVDTLKLAAERLAAVLTHCADRLKSLEMAGVVLAHFDEENHYEDNRFVLRDNPEMCWKLGPKPCAALHFAYLRAMADGTSFNAADLRESGLYDFENIVSASELSTLVSRVNKQFIEHLDGLRVVTLAPPGRGKSTYWMTFPRLLDVQRLPS